MINAMRSILILLISFGFVWGATAQSENFKQRQFQYPKVQAAYQNKESAIKKLFRERGFPYPPKKIFFRAFKTEKKFEVWALKEGTFQHFTTYDFCRLSGTVGPKRREGDFQTPEGFYTIDRFNPTSQYHLSLGIDYPNASDQILGAHKKLGGSIFIHGGCGSSGCIPLTNEKIEELYILAVEAKNQGQDRIPVHIFPMRLDAERFKALSKQFHHDDSLVDFWKNLQQGFSYFEQNRNLFPYYVDADGEYVIRERG